MTELNALTNASMTFSDGELIIQPKIISGKFFSQMSLSYFVYLRLFFIFAVNFSFIIYCYILSFIKIIKIMRKINLKTKKKNYILTIVEDYSNHLSKNLTILI